MTQLSPLTQVTASLWAKSPRQNADRSQGAWLPVLNHLLDVAACAAEILELEPAHVKAQMAADLGLPGASGLAWVLALVALHDLGKASPAFQVLWPEGKAGVSGKLAFDDLLREPYTPHGVVSEAELPRFLIKLGWSPTLAEQVADAVGCHHGFRVDDQDLAVPEPQLGTGNWDKVRGELCRLVTKAVGADYATVPSITEFSSAAFMRLAGLTSFADWLGSSFPLPTQTDFSGYEDPAGYFARARAQARKLLREDIHWPEFTFMHPELPPLGEVFDYIAKETAPDATFSPRPLQTALEQTLAQVDGPTLVLVEAPMGEGKTEAALYAYLQLQRAARHRGLYVALPTQATGSAMFGRLVKFLRAQGSEKPVSIQLAHGGTLLDDKFQKRLEDTRVFYRTNTDASDEDSVEAVRVEEWFTSRKRALLDEFGVGTIDQALLGVLGVSHQFVRLWGLGNRVVVLDEVHAYDTYTSELIAALVAWLRALGSSVIIMSATLPDESRRQLLRAWGVTELTEAPDYPRWTVANQSGAVTHDTIPAEDDQGNVSRPETRVQLRALPSQAEAVARQAVDLAEQGGCVAVIVNTVQRAQKVQGLVMEALRARGVPAKTCTKGVPPGTDSVGVLLYHARYPADERKYRENAVLKFLGKDAPARPRRLILIATQVAEQSLDFDADVMITDLAPVDLMLQRAGRLHRHQRPAGTRHGHTGPVLYVSGLDEWPTASLKTEFWGRVYEPALLYRSWVKLQGRDTITLPTDLDGLIQQVYGGPPSGGLTAEQMEVVQLAEAQLQAHRDEKQTKGMYAHIGLPEEFWEARLTHEPEPDTESVNDDTAAVSAQGDDYPRTRLGEQGVRVIPVEYVDGHWQVCAAPKSMWPKDQPWQELLPRFKELEKTDLQTAQRLYRRSLSLSRWEIVESAQSGQLWTAGLGGKTRGWRAHPLLRDVWPLDLTGGHRDFGKLRVRLDPELGLVYESRS